MQVLTNLNPFRMVHFQNFDKETAVIGKYSEKEILWWLFISQPQMFMLLGQLKRTSQVLFEK